MQTWPNFACLRKVNKAYINWHLWMAKLLVFILIHVDEDIWVPLNVGSFYCKETRKSFSFQKFKWYSSFGNEIKASKFEYLCPLAIIWHIKPKHEFWNFTFRSIIVEYITCKLESNFFTLCRDIPHENEMNTHMQRVLWSLPHK